MPLNLKWGSAKGLPTATPIVIYCCLSWLSKIAHCLRIFHWKYRSSAFCLVLPQLAAQSSFSLVISRLLVHGVNNLVLNWQIGSLGDFRASRCSINFRGTNRGRHLNGTPPFFPFIEIYIRVYIDRPSNETYTHTFVACVGDQTFSTWSGAGVWFSRKTVRLFSTSE